VMTLAMIFPLFRGIEHDISAIAVTAITCLTALAGTACNLGDPGQVSLARRLDLLRSALAKLDPAAAAALRRPPAAKSAEPAPPRTTKGRPRGR
jgi:hypothetical protein